MIINKIALVNFGVFYGRHEFYLAPDQKKSGSKPITLFGGMNGSGKTTVFDAIKLCLYGHNSVGLRSNGKYAEFLASRIHRAKNLLIQPNFASIEVEFQHSRFGEVSTYKIERMWETVKDKPVETLNITKNGKALDDIEKENWQDFIGELVPLGLSQLFFFDGEKIQKMMSDDDNNEFRNSIKSLIGLNLVERLQADLKIYRKRHLNEKSSEDARQEHTQLRTQIKQIKTDEEVLDNQIASLNTQLEKIENRISEFDAKIQAQGGSYFENEKSLQKQRLTLESEIDLLKEKLRELCANLLPVALAQQTAISLKKQISTEAHARTQKIAHSLLKKKFDEFLTCLTKPEFFSSFSGIGTRNQDKIKRQIITAIENIMPSVPQGEVGNLHGLSDSQTVKLTQDIDFALEQLPGKFNDLSATYERKFRKLQKIQVDLNRVPDEELIKASYETRNELYQQLGAKKNELQHIEEELSKLANQRAELERKVSKLNDKIAEKLKTDQKIILTTKTEKTLNAFSRELAKLKIQHLTQEFSDIFSRLHRKRDMISHVSIDPNTFEITLLNKNNNVINKSSLSSGELEIYAMSMVWSLARISGQKLPFIIDTPLGRLDSKHRDNIINLFFPHASHQMIIFSTDTEVDRKYFDLLKPSVSRTYILEHNDQEKQTKAQKGYFWN